MKIRLLIHDGCLSSAVSSISDIFLVANACRQEIDENIEQFDLQFVSTTKKVQATASTINTDLSLIEIQPSDLVIVPAIGTFTPEETEASLRNKQLTKLVKYLERVEPTTNRIAAACTGVFTLAETGLINHHRATTSWFLGSRFGQRYPKVKLDLDRMVVADQKYLTAGAAFAHIDLAITILFSVSADLAHRVSKLMLIDERTSQSAYMSYDLIDKNDPLVIEFEQHVRSHIAETFNIDETARTLGTSRRTLERRIKKSLETTPLGFVQQLRLEKANHLLRSTNLSTDIVANKVGYRNAETLRALMRKRK